MPEFTDYMEILRKRRGTILVCLLIGLLGAGAVFLVMPKVYRSSTLILVESQKVPADFIKPVMVDTIEERLISIQQQIFSRTLLQKIIEEFGLYKDQFRRKPLEEVIEDMRTHIKVTTVDDRLRRNIQAFTIAYEGDNPPTVMKVTDKLASLFIEENLKVREQLVEGTTEFLDQELQGIQQELNRQETQISEFKQKHMGQLPQQAEANLRTLDRLQIERQSASEALRMAEEKREILREALHDPTGDRLDPGMPPSPLRDRLHHLRAQLAQLQSEYKESYPDLVETKRQVQELEAQLADEEVQENGTGRKPARNGPARLANKGVAAQLRALDAEIQARQTRKLEIEKLIKAYEARVEAIPRHEQALTVLIRDYENTKRNYEALMNKKMAAKISESLEKRQKGEQFRIIDPANLPIKPVKPDPWYVLLGGIAVGLALAGGSVWWRDLRNLPFRRPEEVEAVLGLPTLATIPQMSGLWEGGAHAEAIANLLVSATGPREAGRTECASQPASRLRRPALPWTMQSSAGRRAQLVNQANLNALTGEQFRVLAGRVIKMREKKGARVLAVTSSLAGEGKSTLAVGLAVTLARDYREDTILIDGDLRNSSVSARLGLHDRKGLRNVLAGECEVDAVLYQHPCPHLKVLAAGRNGGEQAGLPASCGQAQKLFDDLRQRGGFVILDTPPILPMADMNLYAEIVDGILLVVRAGQTPQHVVGRALDFLSGGAVQGVVLNGLVNLDQMYYAGYVLARYTLAEQPALLFQPVHPGAPGAGPHPAESRPDS